MSLVLPAVSFACGWLVTDIQPKLKTWSALWLSKIFIPYVIVYNMVFYKTGSISLMLFSLFSAICIYVIYGLFSKNRTENLCIAYPNMAWLGFPIAFAIFGEKISAAIVALYIGGSLFGNVFAVMAFSRERQNWQYYLKNILTAPPVIALTIALILRLLHLQDMQPHIVFDYFYQLASFATTVCGMLVLGMWLRHVKLKLQDIVQGLKFALLRILMGGALCIGSWFVFDFVHLPHVFAVMLMLFFLPPAANIVSLETYYAGTGVSARYIAAGTLVSCVLLFLFYGVYHFLI